MNRRSVLIIAAIAIVAVLLAVLGRDRSTSRSPQGAELLPGLTAALNDIEQVEISKAGNETVATLRRGADGWSVDEKDGYPADIAKIRQALVALGKARIVEETLVNNRPVERLVYGPAPADPHPGEVEA